MGVQSGVENENKDGTNIHKKAMVYKILTPPPPCADRQIWIAENSCNY